MDPPSFRHVEMGRQCHGPSGFFDSESDSQTEGREPSGQNAASAARQFPQQEPQAASSGHSVSKACRTRRGCFHIFANPVRDEPKLFGGCFIAIPHALLRPSLRLRTQTRLCRTWIPGGNAKNGITWAQARRQDATTVGNRAPQGLRSKASSPTSSARIEHDHRRPGPPARDRHPRRSRPLRSEQRKFGDRRFSLPRAVRPPHEAAASLHRRCRATLVNAHECAFIHYLAELSSEPYVANALTACRASRALASRERCEWRAGGCSPARY